MASVLWAVERCHLRMEPFHRRNDAIGADSRLVTLWMPSTTVRIVITNPAKRTRASVRGFEPVRGLEDRPKTLSDGTDSICIWPDDIQYHNWHQRHQWH